LAPPYHAHVTDEGPVPNPFEGIPFLGDLAKMLQGGAGGAGRWDAARQFATQVATGGSPESNPDPLERIRYEELARVADLRVADVTGLDTSVAGRSVSVVPVTRSEWSRRTLDAWRPLLERLSTSLTATPVMDDTEGDDPLVALLQGFSNAFGPVLFGMQAGAMVGHLATRALGQYDLPVPRPPSDELAVVAENVAAFGREWSLGEDDLRLWICVSEIATHAVLGVPHVRSTLDALLLEYAAAFRVDPSALEGRLADVDPTNPAALQEALGDPAALLGAISSPEQAALRPRLEAVVAAVEGYVDWVVDRVGEALIPSYGMLTEALRRRRVQAGEGDRFVEHLLGLELGQAQYDRGAAFVDGIFERAGADGVSRLWSHPRHLPTPAELDAPGLWLARIDLPHDPA
jgi:putative hydrolase